MSVLVTYKGVALKHGNAYMHRQVGSPEPEPIVLPPQTIRFRFENSEYDPTVIDNGGVWTKVEDSSYNDWDWYCADTDWESKFDNDNGWAFTEDNRTSIIATGDMFNVKSVTYMFYECTGLTSIPENAFPNLTDAGSYMFSGCTGLTSIPENAFPNLTDAGDSMFYDCTGLTGIAENAFPSLTAGIAMFKYCTGLTSISENLFSNLTDASHMFDGCTGLISISENLFPSLTRGHYMFQDCTGLTSIPENAFPNLTAATYMFYRCLNVQNGALGLYRNLLEGGKVTYHTGTFLNCGNYTETGRAELNQIPEDWGGLLVETVPDDVTVYFSQEPNAEQDYGVKVDDIRINVDSAKITSESTVTIANFEVTAFNGHNTYGDLNSFISDNPEFLSYNISDGHAEIHIRNNDNISSLTYLCNGKYTYSIDIMIDGETLNTNTGYFIVTDACVMTSKYDDGLGFPWVQGGIDENSLTAEWDEASDILTINMNLHNHKNPYINLNNESMDFSVYFNGSYDYIDENGDLQTELGGNSWANINESMDTVTYIFDGEYDLTIKITDATSVCLNDYKSDFEYWNAKNIQITGIEQFDYTCATHSDGSYIYLGGNNVTIIPIPKNNLLNKSFIRKSGDYNFVYMFTENGVYSGLLLNLDGTNIPYIGDVMRVNFNSPAVISTGSYGTITYNDDFTQVYQDIGAGPKLIYSYDALNDTLLSGSIVMSREDNDYSLHKYFDAQTPNIIGTFETSNSYPDRINKFTINETEILKCTLSSDTLQETITKYTYDDYGVNCWLNDNRTTAYFSQATLLIYNPTNDSLYYVRNPFTNDYGVYTRTST